MSCQAGKRRAKCDAFVKRQTKLTDPNQNETLRWPTRLDRGGIGQRLALVREAATSEKLPELAALLPDPASATPAEIAGGVVAALSWLQDKPQHRAITLQLQIVAMNLKNLAGR
jgi:hypothetical protein